MIPIPDQLLAIDPGFGQKNGTGWAMFWGERWGCRLGACGLATSNVDDFEARVREICDGVPKNFVYDGTSAASPVLPRFIEHMRVYPGPQQKGDQNDLLNLAFLEGALARDVPEWHLIEARIWKGNVPKDKMQDRIWGRLSPEEKALVDATGIKAAAKRGSLLDAIGLGLWVTKRLG